MVFNKKELKSEFSKTLKQYNKDDLLREKVIKLSRTITKSSKQAIYAIHRKDIKSAEKLIKESEKNITQANKIVKEAKINLSNNIKSGLEEYVEAKTFFTFITKNKIPLLKDFKNVPYELYMQGLSDFTGEIAKISVSLAIENKQKEIKEIKNIIEEIHSVFIKFDFRSGELRKKFEGIKYNLNKVESIIYDLALKR